MGFAAVGMPCVVGWGGGDHCGLLLLLVLLFLLFLCLFGAWALRLFEWLGIQGQASLVVMGRG